MSTPLYIGDSVKLNKRAEAITVVHANELHHKFAVIEATCRVISPTCFVLDRELMGTCFWERKDLVLIKRKSTKPMAITRLVWAIKPKDRFIPSNFSEPQGKAIKEFEVALEKLERTKRSDKVSMRRARFDLNLAYIHVNETGVRDALTTREIQFAEEIL